MEWYNAVHLKVTVSWQSQNGEVKHQQQWEWQQHYMRPPNTNFGTLFPLLPVLGLAHRQPVK